MSVRTKHARKIKIYGGPASHIDHGRFATRVSLRPAANTLYHLDIRRHTLRAPFDESVILTAIYSLELQCN